MNKKWIIMIMSFIVFIFLGCFLFELKVFINEKESKERIFNDMYKKSNNAIRAVVGIINEKESNRLIEHSGIGSGVIFDKKDNTYYAVTAKHVVNVKDSKLKIFTKDTSFTGQTVEVNDKVNFEIPDEDYYEALLDGKIEYMSKTSDLAIISFEYDGDLTVLEFENEKINKDDRVMVIGHTEGNRYRTSYGYIKSGLKTVIIDKTKDKVIEHNAYMSFVNSGGVTLSENMKIVGINIGGAFSFLHHYRIGYMIPYDIVKININNWKNGR